jgi:hypothetical protein
LMPLIPRPPYDVNVKNFPGDRPDQNVTYCQEVYNGAQGTIFKVPQGMNVRILSIVVQATAFPAVTTTPYLQIMYPYPDAFTGNFLSIIPFSQTIPATDAWIVCVGPGMQSVTSTVAPASWVLSTAWPDIPLRENFEIVMNTGTVATFFAWIYYYKWPVER